MQPDPGPSATYTADQFAPLFAAEDRHFWFQARNRCLAAALRSLPHREPVREVLEVGCGTGVVLQQLQRLWPAAHVVGLDLFPEGLAYARQRFHGDLLCGDVFTVRFDHPFDVVGAFDVIEHVDDDVALLRRLWEHLRPGGHVAVTVPAHQSLWSYFDEVAHHRRRYARAELAAKLSAAGFGDVYVTPFMAALFPLMWVKRRLLGETATQLSAAGPRERQAAAESDLRVPPLLNGLLGALLRPEPLCISRRWRLPLGTSLLALATKPAHPRPGSEHD